MVDQHKAKALVVDDNFFNRDLCRLALESAGYEVIERDNGRGAIDLLKSQTFDLVVLDLAMPEVTGVDVLRELDQASLRRSTFIVVMTANPHMATEEVQQQVDFVLFKPIDVQTFTQFARRLVKREPAPDTAAEPEKKDETTAHPKPKE
ncbi:MAG: response regulator [Anaerolineae bacterium]|nr:response regulator [Anaerolineae bacterium]